MKKILSYGAVFCLLPAVWAADVPAKNWKNETQLSFLSTRGNSQSRTLGAGEKFNWAKDKRGFDLWADALNVESDNK